MNRALQILIGLSGLLFLVMGLRWAVDPSGALLSHSARQEARAKGNGGPWATLFRRVRPKQRKINGLETGTLRHKLFIHDWQR